MKNYIKIPVKSKYEFNDLNVESTFDLYVIDLEKYVKNGFIYIQIIADDDTKPTVKERVKIKIDKMIAKITLNIPIETFHKYIRGRNGGFIYVKDVTKMKMKDF